MSLEEHEKNEKWNPRYWKLGLKVETITTEVFDFDGVTMWIVNKFDSTSKSSTYSLSMIPSTKS